MKTETQNEKKYPTHTVYFLTDKKGSDEKDWNKTGAAWIHADNDGMNLSINMMGQQIALVVRKSKPRE
jgi:hypothetical protein